MDGTRRNHGGRRWIVGIVFLWLWGGMGAATVWAQDDACGDGTLCRALLEQFREDQNAVGEALINPEFELFEANLEGDIDRATLYGRPDMPSRFLDFSEDGSAQILGVAGSFAGTDVLDRGLVADEAVCFLVAAECHSRADVMFRQLRSSGSRSLRLVDTSTPNDGPGSGTTLTSLLSRFGLSFVQDEDDEGLLSADLSFILPNRFRERNAMLKLTTDTSPEISDLVRAQLTVDGMDPGDDVLNPLREELSDGDDLRLAFDWSYLSNTIGRAQEIHQRLRKLLEDQVANAAWIALSDEETLPSLLRLTGVDPRIPADRFGYTPDFLRDLAGTAVEVETESSLIEIFDALVGNQPQLIVKAERRERDELVGSDETSLAITWEQPLGPNLNGFWKVLHKADCAWNPETDEDKTCVIDAFRGYAEELDRAKKATKGWRTAFSLSYKDIDDLDFELPLDGDSRTVQFEGGEDLTIRAGIGRSFGPAPDTDDQEADVIRPTRLDLDVFFTTSSDDDNTPDELKRVDRLRAELKYTLLYGKVSVPLSIVYVNKPEFLALEDDLSDEVSARVGIKYTIPDGIFGGK